MRGGDHFFNFSVQLKSVKMGDGSFEIQLKHTQLMRIFIYFELWLGLLMGAMFLMLDPNKTIFLGVCTFLFFHYWISRRKQSQLEQSLNIPGAAVTINI